MRALVLAVLLAALAPTAAAQDVRSTTFEVEPIEEPIQPLGPEVLRNYTIRVFCEPGIPTRPDPVVVLWVEKSPTWSTVALDPGRHELAGCAGERVERGVMKVKASDQAPAFMPASIELALSYEGGLPIEGNSTGKGLVPITAGYFSILDVQVAEAIAVARPGEAHTFTVKVTNLGNANARVRFEPTGTSGGLRVDPVEPFVLQSKHAGGVEISREVEVIVHAASGAGYLNEVGNVNFAIHSAYALDEKLAGDESSVSFLLTTRGVGAPGPSLLAQALALALALVLFAGRRAGR